MTLLKLLRCDATSTGCHVWKASALDGMHDGWCGQCGRKAQELIDAALALLQGGTMNAYIGTKIVQAEPMSDWTFATVIRPITGRAVDHLAPGAGYKVIYDDGYVSWSPADVFERSYRQVTPAEAILIQGVAYPPPA